RARRALDLAGPGDHLARGGAAGFLGLVSWANGDVSSALETFTQAVASLHAAGNLVDELSSTVVLADMWLAAGRPSTARRLYERALGVSEAHGEPVLRATPDLHVGLSEIDYEGGDLEAAKRHLERAAALGEGAAMAEGPYRWFGAMGRGMRLKSAKFLERWTQDIIIIDVIDGSSKHLLINTDELDRELELEDKIFISDIARQKIRDAIAKREAKMAEQNREKDEVFELYPLPKVKRYYSARLNEEVTEAQLYRLKSMGYATDDTFYTKNMFAEIMANQSAAKQDIDNLTSVGYDTS